MLYPYVIMPPKPPVFESTFPPAIPELPAKFYPFIIPPFYLLLAPEWWKLLPPWGAGLLD